MRRVGTVVHMKPCTQELTRWEDDGGQEATPAGDEVAELERMRQLVNELLTQNVAFEE